MAKVVEIKEVSPKILEIDGGPEYLYLHGKGFEYFKPKNENEQPTGRFEAYILKADSSGIEDEKFIEIVQPTNSSIKDDVFRIEVTLKSGEGFESGERKVVIKNKGDKFVDCAKTDTCYTTANAVVMLK